MIMTSCYLVVKATTDRAGMETVADPDVRLIPLEKGSGPFFLKGKGVRSIFSTFFNPFFFFNGSIPGKDTGTISIWSLQEYLAK